jgi:hypothetical protein
MASEVEWSKMCNAVQNITTLPFISSRFFVILKYLFGIKWLEGGGGGLFLAEYFGVRTFVLYLKYSKVANLPRLAFRLFLSLLR